MNQQWQPCEPGVLSGRCNYTARSFSGILPASPLTFGILLGVLLSAAVSGWVMLGNDQIAAPSPTVLADRDATALTCNQVADALQALIDGPLERSLHQRVEAHLVACDRCQSAYRELQERGLLPANTFLLSQFDGGWNHILLADIPRR